MNPLVRAGLLGLAWGAFATGLEAQVASTGTVQGRVIEPSGRAVVGATVRVSRSSTGFERSVVTDSSGAFRLGFLPPGELVVSGRRIGYRPTVLEHVVVEAGSVTRVVIQLDPAARTLDSVVVTAPVLTIDPEGTEFGTTLTSRELRLLPTPNEARDLVRFVNGARPDQVWGGATAQANNYQLDGIAVNHPGVGGDLIQPSVSWIEEVQVRGLGAGAEHGNFQGGIVNVVTKSGSNRREGDLRVAFESSGLNGSNLALGEAGSEVSRRIELDGGVRGPLVRDRLFYAVFGQVISRDLRVLNQFPGDPNPYVADPPAESDRRFLGKLTWRPSNRDDLTASLARFDTDVDRFGQTGFLTTAATQQQRAGSWLGSVSWQRTWSSRSFLEIKASGYDGTDRRTPSAGSGVPAIELLNQVDPLQYQNAPFTERRSPSNLGLTAQWDWFVSLGGLDHHLKIGADFGLGRFGYHKERNGGLTWRPGFRIQPPLFDPTNPSTWVFNDVITTSWAGEVALESKVANGAVYVQDYLKVTPRLSLDPGLRLGAWRGWLRDTTALLAPVVSTTGVDPRIGLTYLLARDGSAALKLHWGIYHQGLFAGLFDRAAGSAVYSNEERWEYLGPPFSNPAATITKAQRDALAAQGLFRKVETIRLDETGAVKNYRQPYVDESVLGIEKTFGARWKAEVAYVRRRNHEMVALVDRNLASNYTVFYNVTVFDRFHNPMVLNGRPLFLPRIAVSNQDIIYWWNLLKAGVVAGSMFIPPGMTAAQLDALTYRPDNVLTNADSAYRRFDQLQLRLQARYPTWWFDLGAAITRLDGNLNTVAGEDDYGGSSAGPFVRMNEALDGFGRLANQSRTEIKLRVGGNLPWELRGGGFVSYASGDYYTPTMTMSPLLWDFEIPARHGTVHGLFFETTAGQRLFVQPRGSYKYPARLTLDLHLERGFHLGRTELVATLDGFNVLGASAVTEVQTSYNGETDATTSGRLGSVRNRVAPRTVRLGTSFAF